MQVTQIEEKGSSNHAQHSIRNHSSLIFDQLMTHCSHTLMSIPSIHIFFRLHKLRYDEISLYHHAFDTISTFSICATAHATGDFERACCTSRSQRTEAILQRACTLSACSDRFGGKAGSESTAGHATEDQSESEHCEGCIQPLGTREELIKS